MFLYYNPRFHVLLDVYTRHAIPVQHVGMLGAMHRDRNLPHDGIDVDLLGFVAREGSDKHGRHRVVFLSFIGTTFFSSPDHHAAGCWCYMCLRLG